MFIVAHGIDIVLVSRIARLVDEHGQRFLERVYTDDELSECLGDRRVMARLASRFAAKEAAMKALGTGLARGITWHDVAVEKHASGQPRLLVRGRAAEIAGEMGVGAWMVSLSDTGEYAVASVLGGRVDSGGRR